MAFCTSCGAPISGQFCTNCGKPAGSAAVPGAPPPHSGPIIIPAAQPAAPPSPAAATPKKRSWVFWTLIGCLGLVVIAGILVVAGGYYVARRVKQAGFDPALMQTNPGLAIAKLMAAMNPDIEILAVDEKLGIIKVRDKKTGKTLTVNLEEAKKGKIVFEDENKQRVVIQAQGEGDKGSLDIKGPEGSVHMGTGAGQLPDWLPKYPGAEDTGSIAVNSKDGRGATYSFKTNDPVGDVASFYEEALKRAGLEVQRTVSPVSGQGTIIILAAKDSASQRTAQAMITGKGEETSVLLTFEDKK